MLRSTVIGEGEIHKVLAYQFIDVKEQRSTAVKLLLATISKWGIFKMCSDLATLATSAIFPEL